MTRIIVHTIDDMPEEAKGGLPLGCVLETPQPEADTLSEQLGAVVAYGEGATFSGHTAIWWRHGAFRKYTVGHSTDPITVHAVDVEAALMWLRHHYVGPFEFWVHPAPVYLGEFEGGKHDPSA